MNKLSDFSSFNIVVYGGSTDGPGRNEHGLPHFHLLEKNSDKVLGKIDIPLLTKWKESDIKKKLSLITILDGPDITKKQKKEIVKWLSDNNNANLMSCQEHWDKVNIDNNRIQELKKNLQLTS